MIPVRSQWGHYVLFFPESMISNQSSKSIRSIRSLEPESTTNIFLGLSHLSHDKAWHLSEPSFILPLLTFYHNIYCTYLRWLEIYNMSIGGHASLTCSQSSLHLSTFRKPMIFFKQPYGPYWKKNADTHTHTHWLVVELAISHCRSSSQMRNAVEVS